MKRITACIIILIIALSSLNAFALDAGTHTETIRADRNIMKASIGSILKYSSESLQNCVVYFVLPVPEISSNQKIVDYKLNFYTKNNTLDTGYTLGAFKLGASDILNNKGLSGSSNTAAVKNFYRNYQTNGILDAYIYNEKGVDGSLESVKLTSYLHEIESSNDGHMYVAISILTAGSIAIDVSKEVSVEYTVVNKDEVSGYGVSEIKISPEVCDHYNSLSEANIIESVSYKSVIKAYNFDDAAKNVNMYIATYNGKELDGLTHVPVTLNPNDNDIMILTDSFVAPSAGKKIKVMMWDGDGNIPLAVNAEAITEVVE